MSKESAKSRGKVTIRKGGRKPAVNLSNTYGIKGGSGKNLDKPGRAVGAVSQPAASTPNKHSKKAYKRAIRGSNG